MHAPGALAVIVLVGVHAVDAQTATVPCLGEQTHLEGVLVRAPGPRRGYWRQDLVNLVEGDIARQMSGSGKRQHGVGGRGLGAGEELQEDSGVDLHGDNTLLCKGGFAVQQLPHALRNAHQQLLAGEACQDGNGVPC